MDKGELGDGVVGATMRKVGILKRCAAKCTHFTMATQTATRTKALYAHARTHTRTHAHTRTHTNTHYMYKTYTRAAGSTLQFISTNLPCLMIFYKNYKANTINSRLVGDR